MLMRIVALVSLGIRLNGAIASAGSAFDGLIA